jgi:hypothetical protein
LGWGYYGCFDVYGCIINLVTYAGNERWAYHHNNEVLGGC